MKNLCDIQDKLRKELKTWLNEQARNPYGAYYLYYKPSNNDQAGDLLIAENAGAGFELASNERVHPGATTEQNYRMLNVCLPRLPVLYFKL